MRKTQRNTLVLTFLGGLLFVYTNCSSFKASDLTGTNSSSSVGGIGGTIGGTIAGRIPVVGDYKIIPSNFAFALSLYASA